MCFLPKSGLPIQMQLASFQNPEDMAAHLPIKISLLSSHLGYLRNSRAITLLIRQPKCEKIRENGLKFKKAIDYRGPQKENAE